MSSNPSLDGEAFSPRAATSLLGQPAAEKEFLDAWISGRMAHAWLLCGPRGIGKATLAYRIARFVLSGGNSGLLGGLDTSLDDPVIRRIIAGGHADLKVLERGWIDDKKMRTEIPVDDVRSVGAFLSLTPAEGGWRVVIIDSADEMNRSAANALLKVLEEPPRNALLLLVSHSPGRLLPTIRSRCRKLSLVPLAEHTVATLLRERVPDVDEADSLALAKLSEGSIGKALALQAEGGLDLYREMVDLLASLPTMNTVKLHAFSDKVARDDTSFRTIGSLFTGWLAGAAHSHYTEVVAGEHQLQKRLITLAGLDRWIAAWEKITLLFERTGAVNLDRKLVLLDAFLIIARQCHS